METTTIKQRPARRLLPWLIWLLALLLVAGLLRSVSLVAVWAVLQQLTVAKVAVLLAVNGVVLLLLNGRWWLILVGLGYRLPYLKLTAHRLAGYGVSYFTPGPQFGGEPAQVWLIEKEHGVPRPVAISAVTLDKTLELVVNFAFLLVGLLASWQVGWLAGDVGWLGIVSPILFFLLPLAFLIAHWNGWQPVTYLLQQGFRWQRLAQSVQYGHLFSLARASEQEATRFCRQSPGLLTAALLSSLLSWLSLIAEYWLMLQFLGVSLSLWALIAAMTAARLALLLPMPGGLGTLEASQIWALTALGFAPAVGLTLSLLIRLRDILLGGLGVGWLFFAAGDTVYGANRNFFRLEALPFVLETIALLWIVFVNIIFNQAIRIGG